LVIDDVNAVPEALTWVPVESKHRTRTVVVPDGDAPQLTTEQ